MKATQRLWTSIQSDCETSNDSSMLRNEWVNDEVDGFDLESSVYLHNASVNRSKVHATFDDSLDMCHYRVIQNYAVNKRDKMKFDEGFFNESMKFLKCDDSIIKLEDSLDVCNYRQVHNPSEEMDTDEPIFAESHDNTIDSSNIENLNKTYDLRINLDDSIKVYKYRCSSPQPKTPARRDYFTAKYLDRCVAPKALFNTSSPVTKQS